MDPFSTALALMLKNWNGHLLGSLAGRAVVGSITWSDIAVMLSLLLLTLLFNVIAAAVMRRFTHRNADGGTHPLQSHVVGAFGKPLYVLIWAYGFYLASTPLLLAAREAASVEIIRGLCVTFFKLASFGVIFWLFFRLTHVIDARLAAWAARTSSKFDDLLVPLVGRSLRVALPILGVIFALPILALPAAYADVLTRGTSILLIAGIAVILFQAVRICEKAVLVRFDITAADNLRARKVYTQVHVISKVVDVMIALFTVASVLMLFAQVRQFGASLLASAGIIGIIAGIAAQKTIANLLAGFHIALAQPMRVDDVVIVEGEWGRVEEITLTYVVVHIWDDRRLIVPLSYFIEKPFQNWTRTSSGLLGSVFIWVDYSFAVEDGRKALKQIIEKSPKWDRRFWNLQVSDATETTMQLRVLATAADSSTAWDLRCEIREKFIAYIQEKHSQSLPRVRAQLGATSAPCPQS